MLAARLVREKYGNKLFKEFPKWFVVQESEVTPSP